MRSSVTTRVVGCPMTSAGLMPMCTFLPLNFLFTSSFVFSEIGIRPSMKSFVILGMSSITAPIVTPRNRIFLMSSCATAPMIMPTITPSTSGSPSTPNFFLSPSASMSSFENPGILSSSQLMPTANGAKLWQKGCGMEMPERS